MTEDRGGGRDGKAAEPAETVVMARPFGRPGRASRVRTAASPARFAELQVVSNFSFLEGGSHAEELVAQAQALGLAAIAIADRNSLAGVVRAHVAAKEAGIRLIVGARLDLADAPSLLCYPTSRAAYGRLCRLLALGQMRAAKGACHLTLADVAAHAEGQVLAVVPPDDWDWREVARRPSEVGRMPTFPDARSAVREPLSDEGGSLCAALQRLRGMSALARLHLVAAPRYRGDDRARIAALATLAERCGVPLLASNDVLYHVPERRPLQDVLTCIREKCTLADAGLRLEANAERHLKSPAEMARLFRGYEQALACTLEVAALCRFSLAELRYEYPDEPVPPGTTPQAHLAGLARAGLRERFPDGPPEAVEAALERELALIESLAYAPYFLTVHDIVRFARERGILCQGRGSAANSVVCYALAITAVDPTEIDLLFERFISAERKEPPDIDVDFEHERREEVIQYIYERYGRDRAGLAATVIRYRARSAVREVGKAMGLGADTVAALAGMVWGTRSGGALPERYVREAGLDPADALLARTLELTEELIGFPRHLSQHVGGFVLTRGPLLETVPIGNAAMAGRTFIEWDKDDLAALGLLKVDVLALGMLTCIRKAFALLATRHGRVMTLAGVPRDDPAVYDMLCRADSIGVFQVESRAQMNMLPRLKPRTFYDLVIEVAIVRPGPIQGDMVHPYLRRRAGLEAEEYPAPAAEHGPPDELRRILGKTKGVPLFQEQAMRIAMTAARFSSEEANQLRKAMATFRRRGTIGLLEEKMVSRMVGRGYAREFAERCFRQIEGFGEYGFPESHAASFAHLVYVSAWLKCHYPAAFACALLNSQPMGFYAPAQIVRDAREHGVEVRPVDVSFSDWDCSLEAGSAGPDGRGAGPALRLGLRQVDGLAEAEARKLVGVGARSLEDLYREAGLSPATLGKLAAADALRSLGLDRRRALWAIEGSVRGPPLPLLAYGGVTECEAEPDVELPQMALAEHVVADYQTLRLSLKAHPVGFLRPRLVAGRVLSAAEVARQRDGTRVAVCGVVLVRQRPGSAKGVVFMTLEDETGVVNTVVWPDVLERFRKVVMAGRLILVRGRIQRHEAIVHVVSATLEDLTPWLAELAEGDAVMPVPLARADEVARPEPGSRHPPPPEPCRPQLARHPRTVRVLPKSRDFH
jgi:error-prone DNA polymerase